MDPSPATPHNAKAGLRARMRRTRRSLPADMRQGLSLAAQKRLLASPRWRTANDVALYVALPDELDTDLLLDDAWRNGRRLWLPRVLAGEAGRMEFVPCAGRHELRPGPFGLLEPDASIPGMGPDDLGRAFAPDLMLVPGLAFDRQGWRLGFGAGYYDRFLAAAAGITLMGLCFHFQLVDAVPHAAWDRPVHAICTEQCLCEVGTGAILTHGEP